ncbi:MAG TPA: hypothetical protein VGB77_07350 [Abditibacteriaceae bacterium]
MKTNRTSRRAAAALGTLLIAFNFIATPQVVAHEAPCPRCAQTIAQDTKDQDNETVLKIGRKRIEYKCVFCALSEAQSEYKGDLVILAPSEKKGEPVKLDRTGGKWTASTDNARFVTHPIPQKGDHKVCHVMYRAFTSEDAAKAYIEKNKAHLPEAKPITLSQLLEKVQDKK